MLPTPSPSIACDPGYYLYYDTKSFKASCVACGIGTYSTISSTAPVPPWPTNCTTCASGRCNIAATPLPSRHCRHATAPAPAPASALPLLLPLPLLLLLLPLITRAPSQAQSRAHPHAHSQARHHGHQCWHCLSTLNNVVQMHMVSNMCSKPADKRSTGATAMHAMPTEALPHSCNNDQHGIAPSHGPLPTLLRPLPQQGVNTWTTRRSQPGNATHAATWLTSLICVHVV